MDNVTMEKRKRAAGQIIYDAARRLAGDDAAASLQTVSGRNANLRALYQLEIVADFLDTLELPAGASDDAGTPIRDLRDYGLNSGEAYALTLVGLGSLEAMAGAKETDVLAVDGIGVKALEKLVAAGAKFLTVEPEPEPEPEA